MAIDVLLLEMVMEAKLQFIQISVAQLVMLICLLVQLGWVPAYVLFTINHLNLKWYRFRGISHVTLVFFVYTYMYVIILESIKQMLLALIGCDWICKFTFVHNIVGNVYV